MAYFVFDLDETLGNMHSLFYFICDLKHNTFFKNADPERIKQPPEELIEPCILAGSKAGDIVLDPFFGSGTTGAVAQNLGRKWIGCELNKEYETLQNQRLQQLS